MVHVASSYRKKIAKMVKKDKKKNKEFWNDAKETSKEIRNMIKGKFN